MKPLPARRVQLGTKRDVYEGAHIFTEDVIRVTRHSQEQPFASQLPKHKRCVAINARRAA
jgi:hypothetical protein